MLHYFPTPYPDELWYSVDHLPQPFPQQGPWDILHLPSGWDYHGDCRTGAGRNVKCKGDCIEPHAF